MTGYSAVLIRHSAIRCTLWLSLLSVAVPAFGLPQNQSNSGTLNGVVQDPTGAVVAGARVDLFSGDARQQSTTTDESGSFKFGKMPAGSYEIHVEYAGFAPAVVPVSVGSKLTPIRIVMQVAGLQQEQTIRGESSNLSTDTSQNQNSVSLNTQTLNNLPIFDQDYVATMSRFLDSGDIATGGVTLVVDGIEVNNLGVSASAIKDIKINNDPYSTEYARPGRGRIEVTTKPGSLEYHGEFNFIFRDSVLNARDPFALVRPPEQRRIYEGILTGPISHSKSTNFLLSINRNEEDVQSTVFAIGPAGNIQENVASPMRNLLTAGRISHKFSVNNTASWFFSYEGRNNKEQGVGGITLPEAGFNTRFSEYEFRFNDEAILTPRLVNSLRFLAGHYHALNQSVSPAPKLVVNGTFVAGGAEADQLRTEYHVEFTEMLSYSRGKHLIKGGINVPDLSRRGVDNNLNAAGTFYFASLPDYNAQRPYTFIQQQGNGHAVFLEKILGLFVQDDIRMRPNLMVTVGARYYWQNYFPDNNNLAPRLSFAYAPGSSQKTIIRGGAGIFYDRTGPQPISDLLLFDGSRLRMYVIPNPGFPNPLSTGASLTGQPVSVTRLDPTISIPYTVQYSVGVERQLQKSATVGVAYVGSRGIDRFRSRDINAPLPPLYGSRPDSALGVIRQIESSGRSLGDSLEITFRGSVTRYFTGMAQYRLARAYDNTSGITVFPANNYDLTGEWARSDFDRRHRLEFLGTINPGKLFNLGIALSLYTGAPYTMTTGQDDFHDGIANDRPAGVPRNSLQGPGYADLDLRWSHDFFLLKKKADKGPAITVGVDAFNVLNRVNFVSFVGNLSSRLFGLPVSAQPPRKLQLSAKFRF